MCYAAFMWCHAPNVCLATAAVFLAPVRIAHSTHGSIMQSLNCCVGGAACDQPRPTSTTRRQVSVVMCFLRILLSAIAGKARLWRAIAGRQRIKHFCGRHVSVSVTPTAGTTCGLVGRGCCSDPSPRGGGGGDSALRQLVSRLDGELTKEKKARQMVEARLASLEESVARDRVEREVQHATRRDTRRRGCVEF
eukprot:g30566.t1